MKLQHRFLKKIDKNGLSILDTLCWKWLGAKCSSGYGSFKVLGRMHGAHRFSWQFYKGSIPLGEYVLHRCDNRECVNPEHLFLGNHSENMKDMQQKGRHVSVNALKTFCKFGHKYTKENTIIKGASGTRACRICVNKRQRAASYKRSEAPSASANN